MVMTINEWRHNSSYRRNFVATTAVKLSLPPSLTLPLPLRQAEQIVNAFSIVSINYSSIVAHGKKLFHIYILVVRDDCCKYIFVRLIFLPGYTRRECIIECIVDVRQQAVE